MPRRPRRDRPGRLHHLVNRAQGRGALFSGPRDQRFFLSLLARLVRAGRIRVHAYILMTTHFHLIVESLDGKLPSTMNWLESRYAEYLRRTRGEGGHSFQGRYYAVPIRSMGHFYANVRYVDLNVCAMKPPIHPLEYVFGSAGQHAQPGPRPRWLARNLVDCFLSERQVAAGERAAAYASAFRLAQAAGYAEALVELRLGHLRRSRDELDWLLSADGRRRLGWLRRRARTRGGVRPGLPMAVPGSARAAVDRHRRRAPGATLPAPRGQTRSLWNTVEAGLLRDLTGQGYSAIGRITDVSEACARRRYQTHRTFMERDESYGRLVAEIASQALEICFGPAIRIVADAIARRRMSQGGRVSA